MMVESVRFDVRGKETYVAATTSYSIELTITEKERIYKWATGLVQTYDEKYTLVERTLNGVGGRTADESKLRLLAPSGDLKIPRDVANSYATTQCGNVEAKYVSTGQDVTYPLVHKGIRSEVQAIELVFDGKWLAARCGSGKQTIKITYAPSLDLLLAYEYMNYRPDGLLNVGYGWKVLSIN